MVKALNPRRIITAGGTLMCALGIGYFMQLQNGATSPAAAEAEPETQSLEVSAVSVVPLSSGAEQAEVDDADTSDAAPAIASDGLFDTGAEDWLTEDDLAMDEIQLTSAVPETPAAPAGLPDAPLQLALLGDEPISEPPAEETVPAFACDMDMNAVSGAAAMVTLELHAKCMRDTQFTLHHNGMMISAVTDNDGRWTGEVPALSQQAVFIAAFDNGEGAVANAEVDMLDYYDRYVVQWRGESGLQIHAMEYGADYGEPGHVWIEAARDMVTAARGEGGFMLRLGDGADDTVLMAEVYTFPTGSARREGEVAISLEAEVNAGNCGRDIEAQALVKAGDAPLNARDLTLAMPDCDAVGDFLVLKNLYEDLKVARN